MKNMIETKNLTKTYKEFIAVDHVSLHIKKGSIYGFLGPNGAGKSTTMKMLLGLTAPTDGEFQIDNMTFPNDRVRILKEVRNSVNRQVNCETANIHKTVTAAARQIEDIQYIETAKGVRWLSDGLREIAELRLEYPDLPLAELGQKLSKPLGKSGVNHRLRKLSEIAERLRAEQEISLKPKEERS